MQENEIPRARDTTEKSCDEKEMVSEREREREREREKEREREREKEM